MDKSDRLIKVVLEDDDEDTIAGIMGDDVMPADGAALDRGIVERFDRWANIKMGPYSFCVSYLTPVAVYIDGRGCFISTKKWSAATAKHIKLWIKHTGGDPGVNPGQPMSQDELTALFKEQVKTVRWTSKQAKKASTVKMGKYPKGHALEGEEREMNPVGTDRIEVDPTE